MNEIRIRFHHHEFAIEVLERKTFLWLSYWSVILQKTGRWNIIGLYKELWCKEFNIPMEDIKDLT